LIYNPAIYPRRSYNNDLSMIAGRIDKPRNVAEPPKQYNVFAKEFSNLLLGTNTHIIEPLTIAQVFDIQSRPTQKQRSKLVIDTMVMDHQVRLRPFQKSEVYSSASDPRNITSLNTEATLAFSTYTYPFKYAVLNKHKWFSPGKEPREIEQAISEMKGPLIATDFSRFDGSISKWLQNRVVRQNYVTAMQYDHKSTLYTKFNEMHFAKGRTRTGVEFDPGYGTKSGCPFTTDGNTMINAFINFTSLRRLGLEPDDAWASLGLYCGDDGLIVNRLGLYDSILIVCQDLGLNIECLLIGEKEPVPYCGRYFVREDLTCFSFSDPIRTLGKLHLTSNKLVTPTQALVNKASGYAATDLRTPVIGSFVQRVFDLHGDETNSMLPEERYRVNNSWTQQSTENMLPYFCKVANIQSDSVQLLETELLTSDLTKILNKIPNEVKHKIKAIVGDTIVGEKPTARINVQKRKNLMENIKNEQKSDRVPEFTGSDGEEVQRTPTQDAPGVSSSRGQKNGRGSKGGTARRQRANEDGNTSRQNVQRAPTRNANRLPRQTQNRIECDCGTNKCSHRTVAKTVKKPVNGFDSAVQILADLGIDWKEHFTQKSKM